MQLVSLLLLVLVSYAFAESIFDFSVEDAHGNLVPLSRYQDSKVILIVNTASYCGYTVSNYEQLQEMYSRLHPKGLEILAFPCTIYDMKEVVLNTPGNQFGEQEPGSNEDILKFVSNRFGVEFPVFGKVKNLMCIQ